jgi:aspartyl aminopeptidase
VQCAKALDSVTQTFITRSDMGCGSTIGPISATKLGVETIDVGVPQLAMHSIREVCGVDDAYGLYRILIALGDF